MHTQHTHIQMHTHAMHIYAHIPALIWTHMYIHINTHTPAHANKCTVYMQDNQFGFNIRF